MKDQFNNKKNVLAEAAQGVMLNENVAEIKKRVSKLEVGDKTNFGVVKAIGPDSITFKALHTPKTEILFRQRKIGSADYVLMKLIKLTADGKKIDPAFKRAFKEAKSVKESNEFVGAAAAAKVAGEDEFEFDGETFPTTIGLAVAKKIIGENNEILDESNEFVGAAAAAKVAGEDEFEFDGETFPTTIGLAVAKKIMGESFSLEEETEISEATEFVKGDRVMDVRTKLKGTVLHRGNKDEVYVDLGAIKKAISSKNLRLVEAVEQLDEETDLQESEHGEWFTCEIHVKSSGQLYSTFYVQARDMGEAKKKADKVFKELMKTTYPKDWPGYQKKFTVKVKKGDNIGELMP